MKLVHAALLVALVVLPAATALPVVCGTDCRIAASSIPGYDPAIAIIASGSTVTWHATDVTHFQRDMAIGVDACFETGGEAHGDSEPVRFDIVGGALVATMNGITSPCESARGDGAGGFVLPYFCVLHPTMRAAIVVTN